MASSNSGTRRFPRIEPEALDTNPLPAKGTWLYVGDTTQNAGISYFELRYYGRHRVFRWCVEVYAEGSQPNPLPPVGTWLYVGNASDYDNGRTYFQLRYIDRERKFNWCVSVYAEGSQPRKP